MIVVDYIERARRGRETVREAEEELIEITYIRDRTRITLLYEPHEL